ncbi:hypothetical protein K7B06_14895 [Streptomyces erythrochromogenes]|uniref:hypothetical protein n=1 Tax=Streptomyces sp. gCLA4 TaxID=1873416 RepID=UPI001602BE53|nr:hypothetical protein [Streptomyces sp. gCLA4]MBZ9596369.1 hypothetical protein [Streptomyces erythrochromogenes]
MSVSRTSMSLAATVLVTVIGLGSAAALDAPARNTVAGAGWDVAPTGTDGAGWDVVPATPDGAGWD